ncbi:hypothetical protein [Corynebacterium auriscanis]|uniref:hypothetical protein n=1 Tax=Corynebacterium auriscanis TaxID=99807 RepID=UPI0022469510|nr:hypothetical protein [Corynebacterium auriscanis]MCX2164044.1 hypothetical protein [Corynebacterium auriscanis]
MTHTQRTPQRTPRREPHHKHPRPKLFHKTHHIEPDGTAHTYCGLTINPRTVLYGTQATTDRIPCAACEAATILMEIEP